MFYITFTLQDDDKELRFLHRRKTEAQKCLNYNQDLEYQLKLERSLVGKDLLKHCSWNYIGKTSFNDKKTELHTV